MSKKATVQETVPRYDNAYLPGDDDPLASILGPGSNTNILGNPGEEIPDEIVHAIAEHGLGARGFKTILKQIPEGASETDCNAPYIKGWDRAIPTIDYIAREYGPGTYVMIFSWRTTVEGKQKVFTERVSFIISDKYENEYKEYQFARRLKEMEKRREKIRDMKINGEMEKTLGLDLEPDKKEDLQEAAIRYVDNVTSMAEKLGLSRVNAQVPATSGMNWREIAPLLLSAVPAVMKMMQDSETARREESRQYMTLLISTMSQNNSQMLDVLKNQQPRSGSDMAKEMFDMIREAIDVKEMIQGQGKDSIADRIFNVIEGVAPQLMEVAKLSAMQRAHDPRALIAQTYMRADPDFQQLKKPEVQSEVIRRMDEVFGWTQTDAVLTAIGMERNADCPRIPEKELPIDQRQKAPPETESEDELTTGIGE